MSIPDHKEYQCPDSDKSSVNCFLNEIQVATSLVSVLTNIVFSYLLDTSFLQEIVCIPRPLLEHAKQDSHILSDVFYRITNVAFCKQHYLVHLGVPVFYQYSPLGEEFISDGVCAFRIEPRLLSDWSCWDKAIFQSCCLPGVTASHLYQTSAKYWQRWVLD